MLTRTIDNSTSKQAHRQQVEGFCRRPRQKNTMEKHHLRIWRLAMKTWQQQQLRTGRDGVSLYPSIHHVYLRHKCP